MTKKALKSNTVSDVPQYCHDGTSGYYVMEASKCPVCRGDGKTVHKLWSKWYDHCCKHPDQTTELPYKKRLVTMRQWWSKQDEKYKRQDAWPPEVIPCSKCKSKGFVLKWVSIREALKKIGFFR